MNRHKTLEVRYHGKTVGTKAGIPSKWCSETASAVQITVQSSLKKYLP
jgi:hypothetical protein